MHFTGAGLNARVDRCVAISNGTSGAYGMGDIYVAAGTVTFSNVLAARAVKGNGIRVTGGNVSVVNATLAWLADAVGAVLSANRRAVFGSGAGVSRLLDAVL